ncbi:MAG: SDR family oxidoreductase [Candidatus Marinimicrobia bacterium]|nr:SDR family oxidoreductase [Candidatus Neomarinimicrobiota bacterium]MCF7829184.1 SDR family oxidoreductase [Candidatus Neomarinimicrobiota bacterium]MCF7881163.1 SDR family oxidoreductase [Candidatus Neomarinimicrobiota bacterium]
MPQFDRVFIVGCGDIGKRVAAVWQDRSKDVLALARSPESAEKLESLGITSVHGDLDKPESLKDLPLSNALMYYLAPPPRDGVTDSRMAHFLNSVDDDNLPAQFIYMSTSGVYGDTGGQWVAEDAPLNPTSDRSRRRVDAEKQVREWCSVQGIPYNILRVPGIYGPGRLPIDKVKRGRPVLREEDSPHSNRIHADDLARICAQVATDGHPNEIYNVRGDEISTVTQYYYTLADLLGVERPPTITWEEAQEQYSPISLSFLKDSKRLDISKLQSHLDYQFLYPSLEEGLRATLREADIK